MKRKHSILGSVLVAVLLVGGLATPALAHHATGGGEAECQPDGTYKITWTITNPAESWNAPDNSGSSRSSERVMHIDSSNPDLDWSTTEVSRGSSATATQDGVPGDSTSAEVQVSVHWEWTTWSFGWYWDNGWKHGAHDFQDHSGHGRTEKLSIRFGGDCEALLLDPAASIEGECVVDEEFTGELVTVTLDNTGSSDGSFDATVEFEIHVNDSLDNTVSVAAGDTDTRHYESPDGGTNKYEVFHDGASLAVLEVTADCAPSSNGGGGGNGGTPSGDPDEEAEVDSVQVEATTEVLAETIEVDEEEVRPTRVDAGTGGYLPAGGVAGLAWLLLTGLGLTFGGLRLRRTRA